MHCVSRYPAKTEDMNLYTISDMRYRFGVDVGLSDHSLGFMAATGATALGAAHIEKHLKVVERCPDSEFSVFPDQFHDMITACEAMKDALGAVKYAEDGPYKRKLVDGKMVRVCL